MGLVQIFYFLIFSVGISKLYFLDKLIKLLISKIANFKFEETINILFTHSLSIFATNFHSIIIDLRIFFIKMNILKSLQ
jgi:hypothetical protein